MDERKKGTEELNEVEAEIFEACVDGAIGRNEAVGLIIRLILARSQFLKQRMEAAADQGARVYASELAMWDNSLTSMVQEGTFGEVKEAVQAYADMHLQQEQGFSGIGFGARLNNLAASLHE